MKKCLVLVLLLAGSLTACTPLGEFLHDAQATDAAATEIAAAATQTAAAPTPTPTATFTPAPTPTPTLTPTETPSPTLTASPSPSPAPTFTPFPLPEGWQDYGGEGFALALPESWNVVEVDREGIEAILEMLENLGSEWGEAVAASLSAEQMEEALKLWAMDSELAGLGFATLNLQHQDLPLPLPASMFLDQIEAMYEQLEVEVLSVEPDMQINDLEAGRICVRLDQGLAVVQMCQYVYVQDRDLWALTLGVDEEAWSEYEPIFAQIAGTLRLY
jgi:hypothetical protein